MADLNDLLGEAYRIAQVQADRPAAVKMLKDAFDADPELMTAGRARYIEFGDLLAARPGSCHVSAVLYGVLLRAFAPE